MDIGFNPQEVEAQGGFDALPAGTYSARFKECELKTTKAGDGQYLQVVWDIAEPEAYEHRLVWDRMNIHNPNATAQDIGRRLYKQMATALGQPVCDNPEMLVDGMCRIKLKVRKSPDYGDSNEVSGYAAIEGAPATAAKSAPTPAKPAAAAPPWARKQPG